MFEALIFAPFFLLLSLRSPFTWANIGFAVMSFFIVRWLIGVKWAALVISLATVLLWLSLALSVSSLPQTQPINLYDSMSKAGFPFPALAYPHSSMGSDVPPLEMWLPYFANYFVYLLIASLVVKLLPTRHFTKLNTLFSVRGSLISGLVSVLLVSAMIMLQFD